MTKSNKYTFYFLRDNERNSAFGLPDWDENDIFSNAKAMGIDEIWKYNSENFYRCIFELGPGFRPQVFMLKSGQKNMTSSRIPDFAEIPMMINEKKIDKSRMLYKIDDAIFVYFPATRD